MGGFYYDLKHNLIYLNVILADESNAVYTIGNLVLI